MHFLQFLNARRHPSSVAGKFIPIDGSGSQEWIPCPGLENPSRCGPSEIPFSFILTKRTATSFAIVGLASGLPFSTSADAAAAIWNGGGADNNWNTANNWGGTAPGAGDSLTFGGSTRLAPANNFTAGTSFGGITFASGAGAFTLAGTAANANSIALAGPVVNSSSNLQTFTLPISVDASQTFNTGAAGLTLGATGGGASGVVSGTGGITKEGSGTLTLNATNTYTGATNITSGTLLLANSGTGKLSSSTAVTVASAALFNIGSYSATVGSIHGQGNISGTGNITLTSGGNNASTLFSGAIAFTGGAGSGTLVKNGTGTLTLAGTNTYGVTTINAGTLVFQKTSAKGTGTATAAAAGTIGLGVGGSGDYSVSQVGNLFNSTLTGFSLNSASGVAIDTTAGNFSQTVALTAARALTKLGGNTLTLAGTNTYTGATTVAAGTLAVTGSLAAGSAVTVASGAKLTGNGTIGGAASVFGTLAPTNDSTLLRINGTTTLNSGSIYEWDINTENNTRGAGYDGLNTVALAGTGAIFKVVLHGTQDFSDTFWNGPQIWTDIFKTANGGANLNNWASVFSGGFEFSYNGKTLAPTSEGSFSLNGNSLEWSSAVPETSNAVVGLLLAGGLWMRRRTL
jgi:autotransporter-associated beta strand protein